MTDIFLEQFYVFGDLHRHNPEPLKAIMQGKGLKPQEDHWLLGRFVSIGYYARVDFTQAVPNPDSLSDRCDWNDLANLPPLILDHQEMISTALDTLRSNLDQKLIGFNLLTENVHHG